MGLLMKALIRSFVVHSTRYKQRESQYRFYGLFKPPEKTLFLCTGSKPEVCAHVDPYDHFAFLHHHAFDQPIILTLFVTFVSFLALYLLLDSRIYAWFKLKLRWFKLQLRKIAQRLITIISLLLNKRELLKWLMAAHELFTQWESADTTLKKEQTLYDMEILCIEHSDADGVGVLWEELTKLRNKELSLAHIAAENGKLIPVLPLVHYRSGYWVL